MKRLGGPNTVTAAQIEAISVTAAEDYQHNYIEPMFRSSLAMSTIGNDTIVVGVVLGCLVDAGLDKEEARDVCTKVLGYFSL